LAEVLIIQVRRFYDARDHLVETNQSGRTEAQASINYCMTEGCWKYSYAAGLSTVVLLTCLALSSRLFAPSQSIVLDVSSIQHDAGAAFTAQLNFSARYPYEIVSDDNGESTLRLFENGRLLGPAHALHVSIRTLGRGHYSHWHRGLLWFSSGDNTDPRTNGRRYVASATAQLASSGTVAVVVIDLAFVLLFYRRLSALLLRFGSALALGVAVASIGAAALVAYGAFTPFKLDIAGPANSALIVDTLRCAGIGCILTLIQWAAGAGIALALWRDSRASCGHLLLLGFPLGLILLALAASIAVALPFGAFTATTIVAFCLLPLARWRPQRYDLIRIGKVILTTLPLALIFGCWLGLLAHGPTAMLSGRPSGDVVYYASSISALRAHLFPVLYLGNEGEHALPFNMLFPTLGTALLPYIRLDLFLFILAGGGSMYVLGLSIAVWAYLSTRTNARTEALSFAVLGLAVIVAGRYPYWVVESIPVVFTLPLTIAVWYRVWHSANIPNTISNFGFAVIGAALSKVTSAATLAPLALTPVATQINKLTPPARIACAIAIAPVGVCALILAVKLGPFMLGAGMVGPESYVGWHYGVTYDLPFLLRDIGTVLLIVLAYRLTSWAVASSLALGLTLGFVFSFFMRVNFACAAVILGLIFVDNTEKRKSDKFFAVTAFGLCLPAMLMRDFGGYPGGFFWLLCVGGAVWIALTHAVSKLISPPAFVWFRPVVTSWTVAVVSLVAALCLVAVARGQVILFPGSRNASLEISPDVRDIWLAVRDRTPADSLVFTDQTGPQPGLLTGWNTFALSGERQVYVAGWYQSVALRMSPTRRAERLAINDEVLSGRRQPTDLTYSRAYGAYFAVVQRDRAMPPAWKQQYANPSYILYRYEPPG
jgi:hypothetical protein